MKIKAEMIGALTQSKTVGTIRVKAEHAEMFFNEGRFDLLEGVDEAGELIPISDMTKAELQETSKDIDGYKSTLKKAELIELIENEKSD